MENAVSNRNQEEITVIGVRVLEYLSDEQIKIIGCTQNRGEITYPNNSVTNYNIRQRMIYVFQNVNDSWDLQAWFLLDSNPPGSTYSNAVRDWWYVA